MSVHRLWRFPRGPDDLQSALNDTSSDSFAPGLNQLNPNELAHLQCFISRYHTPNISPEQSYSMVVQRIKAPVEVVWSVVRQFDKPQAYKHFISSCCMQGDGQVGSTREVRVVSGLPAAYSTERLEVLDEEKHVFSFKVVGGQHRLRNYMSTTTLHRYDIEEHSYTIVIESYSVDVPEGNSREETKIFADTIVRSNLQSLARTSEILCQNAGNVVFV